MPIARTVGAGIDNGGSPFVIPSGASADVEVVANQVTGFTYVDTATLYIRTNITINTPSKKSKKK